MFVGARGPSDGTSRPGTVLVLALGALSLYHLYFRLKNGMDCIDDFFMSVYLVECVLKIYVMRREVNFQKTIYVHKISI